MKEIDKDLRTEQMHNLIKSISAYIEQYHGGSAEMVSFEDDVVKSKVGWRLHWLPFIYSHIKRMGPGYYPPIFPGSIGGSC